MSDSDQMAQDALEAQKFTRKHFVVGLDFSPQSVSELDPLCDDVEFMLAGGKSEENIELLRKQCDGQWVEDDGRCLQIGDGQLRPHEQVRRRLTEGAEFSLPNYVEPYLN